MTSTAYSSPFFSLPQFESPNLTDLLREKVPPHIFQFLEISGDLGDVLSVPVFVVGGFVRDLIINQPNEDLDLVIEGDGLNYAKKLNEKINGKRVRTHPEFQTATVTLQNGLEIDVATARLEHYAEPAALPTVKPSDLKMDLFRRDFTINAMAIQLNKRNFGKLIDYFNSQEDLELKSIQVLHDNSFIEDPTRIFRAIRFEQRYAFAISKSTLDLIHSGIQSDIMSKLSKSRIFHEIIDKIIFDKRPHLCFIRMKHLGILSSLCPSFEKVSANSLLLSVQVYHDMDNLLKKLEKSLTQTNKKSLSLWKFYFLGLCSELQVNEIEEICSRLGFESSVKEEVLSIRNHAYSIYETLFENTVENLSSLTNSRLYHQFYHLRHESILYLILILRKKIENDSGETLEKKVRKIKRNQNISRESSESDIETNIIEEFDMNEEEKKEEEIEFEKKEVKPYNFYGNNFMEVKSFKLSQTEKRFEELEEMENRQKDETILSFCIRYFTELQFRKILLTGNHLKSSGMKPGPLFSSILTQVLEADLDQLINYSSSKKEDMIKHQLEYALQIAQKV